MAPNKAKRISDIKHILSNNDNSESIKYNWNSYVWLVCIIEAGRTHKCEMENANKLDDDGNIELQRPNCTNLWGNNYTFYVLRKQCIHDL